MNSRTRPRRYCLKINYRTGTEKVLCGPKKT
ncbi:hypothetical protein AAY473_030882 [Plecturocebus cupreus]